MEHRDYQFLIHFDTPSPEAEAGFVALVMKGIEVVLDEASSLVDGIRIYPTLIQPPEDVLDALRELGIVESPGTDDDLAIS